MTKTFLEETVLTQGEVIMEHQGKLSDHKNKLDNLDKKHEAHEKEFKALHARIDTKSDKSKAFGWLKTTVVTGIGTGIIAVIGTWVAWLFGLIKF